MVQTQAHPHSATILREPGLAHPRGMCMHVLENEVGACAKQAGTRAKNDLLTV